MKPLIKLLIIIVALEIILGYVLYLRDSPRMTGHYISSTLHVLDKLIPEKQIKKQRSQVTGPELLKLVEAKAEKLRLEEAEEKLRLEEAMCGEYNNLNHELNIADMIYGRGAFRLQTSIDNLNTSDFSNKYIIVIAGNSESYGVHQRMQERLHIRLEEKLKNKFKSDNIIVLNLSAFGFFLNDQLHSIQNFSTIYNPDLVIFYTGGNEMRIGNYYEDVLTANYSFNFDNEYWYEFSNNGKKYTECLNQKNFMTQLNFHKKPDLIDISKYINNGFIKIKKYFSNINTDFFVYLHPLNKEEEEVQGIIKEFQDIKIPDNRFLNLSIEYQDLDFKDAFHTADSNTIANKILEDIVLSHEQKIINKISISSK